MGIETDKLTRQVFLARHARTALNADGRLRGHLDPPLDDQGRAEAAALAMALVPQHFTLVVTSPLRRAVETGEAIAAACGATRVVDELLIDRDYGAWAGQDERAVRAQFGSLDAAPGVETAESVIQRAYASLEACLVCAPQEAIMLVSHDAVNRLLLNSIDPALGDPETLSQETACWNLLRHKTGRWHVEIVGRKANELS